MTLAEAFKTNCRATVSLCGAEVSLSFKELLSGFNNKNKNGTVARFSFNDFFIDIYFIENGPLAYAPNTIWLSVGFESVSFLPFSVYDILAFYEPTDFKCYTYPYIYTTEIMVQAFGEINDLFKKLLPALTDISENGVKKNRLIDSQKSCINTFVNDDIFKKEIEILDASLRIRDMLIRNYTESVISHTILGGVSDFYNGNKEKAIKKLRNAKHKTPYEENLLKALINNELNDFDPSPFRDKNYKNYVSVAKKHTYGLGFNNLFRLLVPVILLTPVTSVVLFGVYFLLCAGMFKNSLTYFNCDIFSVLSVIFAGVFVSDIICINFPQKINKLFRRKRKETVKTDAVIQKRKKSKVLTVLTILTETFAIVLLFTAVNCSVAFYPDRVSVPTETTFVLKQETIRYEYVETVYKAEGFYMNNKFIEEEHFIIETKNGDIINLSYYLNSKTAEFEKKVLPVLIDNGCEVKNIKSEKDIKK